MLNLFYEVMKLCFRFAACVDFVTDVTDIDFKHAI